ncbi:ComEA family DNA-binding protein [Scatolibacter rhodanostii]|uniref:ComEA family DNA-binding protein n=1 Tax=Scatolibacter rhodanostii TaxID=2014781 RepID=UPI000C071F37|nr:helix-hairpin-helix domain-containing protein [Scatolibacter rhodanostii]
MREDKQVTLLIGVGLFFCMLILGYATFYAQPIQLYAVTNSPATTQSGFDDTTWNSSVSSLAETSFLEENFRLININTATLLELMELEGIGESTAKKIIQYREENGPFSESSELLNISGIGEKKFASIEPYVTVNE